MAEGFWLRTGLLAGLDEQTLDAADFHRILSLARRHQGPKRPDEGAATPDPSVLARQMSTDLSCFRRLASSVGFPPLLVELALIDDESLERSQHSREQRVSALFDHLAMAATDEYPEFVSVLAAYDKFAEDDRLLRAWHRATSRVVVDDGRSIVGTPESYEYVYLWDQLSRSVYESRSNTPSQPGIGPFPERSDFVSVHSTVEDELALMGLPVFYSFGDRTSSELAGEHHQLDRPPKIARRLLAHLLDTASEEFGEHGAKFLEESLLVVIPFTRPSFYGSVDLNAEGPPMNLRSKKRGDRAGGAVFLLCRDAKVRDDHSDRFTTDGITELNSRIRRFAIGIWWLMFRSAMLEARQERDNTREADLAQYSHLIAKSLRRVTTHVYNARSDAEDISGIPLSVVTELDHAQMEAKRLAEIGEIARAALLIKSGRAAMKELSLSIKISGLEAHIRRLVTDALIFAKTLGIQNATRRAHVKDVSFTLDSQLSDGLVRTSESYLGSLIGELVKNAVEYGGYGSVNGSTFSIQLSTRGRPNSTLYTLLRISNPIRDEIAKRALSEIFLRRRLHLGLSHIELLAQVFDLPLPYFVVEGNNAVVYSAVGLVEAPKDRRE